MERKMVVEVRKAVFLVKGKLIKVSLIKISWYVISTCKIKGKYYDTTED